MHAVIRDTNGRRTASGRAPTQCGGFTLMEVLIYITLFVFVIGGGLMAAYQIFDGSANIQAKAYEDAELNFILRKIDWIISGLSISDPNHEVLIPAINGNDNELLVSKDPYQYHITLDTGQVIMRRGGISYPLNNANNLNVTDIEFSYSSGNPYILSIDIEVDGQPLDTITRYVRAK